MINAIKMLFIMRKRDFKVFILLFLILLGACNPKISYVRLDDRINIELSEGQLSIIPLSDKAFRIQLSGSLNEKHELVLVNEASTPDFMVSEQGGILKVSTHAMTVTFNQENETLQFLDHEGNVFLSEKANSRKFKADSVMGEPCYFVEQSFDSPEDEFLFGLGQFQDGHYNLRNVSRKLIQVNSQIAIPFLYSSKGYGLLWHQYGLTAFNPTDSLVSLTKSEVPTDENSEVEVTTTAGTQKVSRRQSLFTGSFTVNESGKYTMMLDLIGMDSRHLLVIDGEPVIDQSNLWLPPAVSQLVDLDAGEHTVQIVCSASNTPNLSWKIAGNSTTFRSPHAKSLDYVVFSGNNADEIINSYRALSGQAPMLPLWAYGFWQCRERYVSADHLVNTVKEFRARKLPLDVIVQDWQYWGDRGWGVPQLDTKRYPDPASFIKAIHDMNAHFAISIWSNPDKNSEIGKAYVDRNLFIPNTKWLDYFNPETSESYWKTLNDNLFVHGVDSWWMDATEPENDALTGTMTYQGPGDFYRLTYPLFVSKSVYEGQRKVTEQKRVAILTRSAFAGQQRYGTINWSGDIGGTWDGMMRQMLSGMNFIMTGMPFWTTDIGGFFRPGDAQYTSPDYHELLTRWFQWGAFSTIFRVHGYQSETEPWKYGTVVEENMRKMLNVRYSLIPYIYSEAWKISNSGSTMMRPLVMDFQNDPIAVGQAYEYMFGASLLVAPVIEPGVITQEVYLPKSANWFDFWTGKQFEGGQTIQANAPIDQIPVFVKAGAIIPMSKPIQHTSELSRDTLDIRVYAGADGAFVLYEDEGDNYNYEKGAFTTIRFEWNEAEKQLLIKTREGSFEGMSEKRFFNIALFNGSGNPETKRVDYDGKDLIVTF
jgi:alpha-D-xyloside xylohydrolase